MYFQGILSSFILIGNVLDAKRTTNSIAILLVRYYIRITILIQQSSLYKINFLLYTY